MFSQMFFPAMCRTNLIDNIDDSYYYSRPLWVGREHTQALSVFLNVVVTVAPVFMLTASPLAPPAAYWGEKKRFGSVTCSSRGRYCYVYFHVYCCMLGCGLMFYVSFLAEGETRPCSHPRACWRNRDPFRACGINPAFDIGQGHLWKPPLNGCLDGLTTSGDLRLTPLCISSRQSMWAFWRR